MTSRTVLFVTALLVFSQPAFGQPQFPFEIAPAVVAPAALENSAAADNPELPAIKLPSVMPDNPGSGLRYSGNIVGVPWGVRLLHGVPVETGMRVAHVTFSKSGEVTIFGGCNVLWGNYRSQLGNRLVVTHLRGTRKACTQDAPLERKIASALILANAYRFQDNQLSLFQSEFPERVLMVLEADPGLDTSEAKAGRDDLVAAKNAAIQKKKATDRRAHKAKKAGKGAGKNAKKSAPVRGGRKARR